MLEYELARLGVFPVPGVPPAVVPPKAVQIELKRGSLVVGLQATVPHPAVAKVLATVEILDRNES
jgi:hypothetical protein